MPFIYHRRAIAVAGCLLSANIAAQQSIPKLDNVVVTASRTQQLQKDALGDVTVIDQQTLRRAGQDSIPEILSKHHGIQFYSNGGPQTTTGVMVRGNEPRHTLVLVDGVRINSLISNVTNWNAIDPATVERIEILRGAASSLYGSDAIGGVINIITTKSGEDRPLSAWANVGIGSHDTFKSSAGISGASDGWDYSISSSMAESSGFNATRRPEQAGPFDQYNRDADGYTQRAVSASLGHSWKPGHRVGLTAYNGYTDGDYDNGALNEPAYTITRQQAYTLSSSNDMTEYWQSELRFGYSKELVDNRSYDAFSNAVNASVFSSQQRSYMWQNTIRFAQEQSVSLILERLEESPSGGSKYSVDQRNTNAAGLVYRADFNRHHLQASVRNDNISGYGDQTTGGLTYDLDLSDQWIMGLAANTGFRAPSFTELYSPLQWGFLGNPGLQPEKSRNIEASLRYVTDTTQLSLVGYQNKVRNLIDGYVCFADCAGFSGLYHAENVDSATIRGLTLKAERQYGATGLRASVDFLQPTNDSTGNQLRWRSKQVYQIAAERRINNLVLGAEFQFNGKRYNDAENRRPLGGYGLVNMTAAYDFNKNVGVQVRWNNALNKDYTTVYGYNTPGSNVFVNLSFRM